MAPAVCYSLALFQGCARAGLLEGGAVFAVLGTVRTPYVLGEGSIQRRARADALICDCIVAATDVNCWAVVVCAATRAGGGKIVGTADFAGDGSPFVSDVCGHGAGAAGSGIAASRRIRRHPALGVVCFPAEPIGRPAPLHAAQGLRRGSNTGCAAAHQAGAA